MSIMPGDQTSNDDLAAHLRRIDDGVASLWIEVHAIKAGDVLSSTDVAEIKQALAWQITLHRWIVRHKVKASIRIALGAVAIPLINQGLAALIRWLGWN